MSDESPKKTHQEVNKPRISSRYLADYMAASEQARRTIVRDCKYRPRARLMQHKHGREAVAQFVAANTGDADWLKVRAEDLREAIADSDFDRSVLDNNADYIEHFAKASKNLALPNAAFDWTPKNTEFTLNGVTVRTDIYFRCQRVTKTNKIRIGGGCIRYQKDTPLKQEVANWQSAFVFGHLNDIKDDGTAPEHKLCLTICAQSGIAHPAPTDSISRYKNMLAALASIAERWPAVEPPPNAVL